LPADPVNELIALATVEGPTAATFIDALWEQEALAYRSLVASPESLSLGDPRIPAPLQPTLHLALGMAAVQQSQSFDASALLRIIEERGRPTYRKFAWEAVGAALGCYQRDVFSVVTALLGRLGVLLRRPARAPVPRTFLHQIPDRWQPAVSHGLGRLYFFKSLNLGSAYGRARSSWFPEAACRGVGFVRSLLALRRGGRLPLKVSGPLPEATKDAALNVLVYLLWSFPGKACEKALVTQVEPALLETARRILREAQSQGQAVPFRLSLNSDPTLLP